MVGVPSLLRLSVFFAVEQANKLLIKKIKRGLTVLYCLFSSAAALNRKMLSVTSRSGTDSERKEYGCGGLVYFSLLSLFRRRVF